MMDWWLNRHAVEAYLQNFMSFWRTRGRFLQLAFQLDAVGNLSPSIPQDHEFRLNAATTRALWQQALQDAGENLTAETAIELMKLGRDGRLAKLDEIIQGLGITAAGR